MSRRMGERVHLRERFERHIRVSDGCYEWTGGLTSKGYAQIRFGNKHQQSLAHRVAWKIYMGTIPDGLYVCHQCDNPKCVRIGHLFLGTQFDNMRDCASKGRMGNRKLSIDDVMQIVARARSGETGRSLAKEFNVEPSTISNIKNRKAWRWANEPCQ